MCKQEEIEKKEYKAKLWNMGRKNYVSDTFKEKNYKF